MKTPKEKADELVKLFIGYEMTNEKIATVQCAIHVVEKIIESSPSLPILSDSGIYGDDIKLSTEYYNEVKNELNKMI